MSKEQITQEHVLDKMNAQRKEVNKFIVGEDEFVRNMQRSFYSGVPYSEGDRKNVGPGHALLMAAPGMGKTDGARVLANTIDAKFSFLGFHPEMKTSDILGSEIYDQATGQFFFAEGPIHAHIVLADEINRGHPKGQATTLQVMEERVAITSRFDSGLRKIISKITKLFPISDVPGENRLISWIIATGNPFEQEGTYPIPEAQLDRFTTSFDIDFPEREDEKRIRLETFFNVENEEKGPKVEKVISLQEAWKFIRFIIKYVKPIEQTPDSNEYLQRLIENSRPCRKGKKERRQFAGSELMRFVDNYVKAGLSVRANFHFQAVARTIAFMRGCDYISIDDIQDAALLVMAHRILLKPLARGRNIKQQDVIEEILRLTKLP